MRNRWRGRTALIALQGVAASAPFGAQDTAFEPVTDEILADPDHAAPHAVRGDDRRPGGLHGAVDDLAAALPIEWRSIRRSRSIGAWRWSRSLYGHLRKEQLVQHWEGDYGRRRASLVVDITRRPTVREAEP